MCATHRQSLDRAGDDDAGGHRIIECEPALLSCAHDAEASVQGFRKSNSQGTAGTGIEQAPDQHCGLLLQAR